MLQGLLLGPLLFIVDINDLEENVDGKRFVSDTKIVGIVESEEGWSKVTIYSRSNGKVARKWMREFNSNKCKVMH